MATKNNAQRVTLEVKTPESKGENDTDREDDDAPESDRHPGVTAPLFDVAKFSDEIAAIAVERIEPAIDEGYLGRMDPHASEGDLKSKWGGGRYHITARNGAGHIKAHRFLNIAGDPRFESKAARRRWKRAQEDIDAEDDPPRPNNDASSGMQEFLQMQMAMIREDSERRERADREERERREREAREERERRDRDQAAREERARRDLEDARARDREHMQTMMTLVTAKQKGSGGELDAFTRGIEMAMKLGGGRDDDEDDPYGLKSAVAGLLKGMGGGDDDDEPDPVETVADKTGVRITGATAEKMREFMRTAQERGVDPEKALDTMLDAVQTQIRKKAAVQGTTDASPASSRTPATPDPKPEKTGKPDSRDQKRAQMRARLKARIADRKSSLKTTDRGGTPAA